MKNYRAAVIGCGRMGAFIDNEVVDVPGHVPPYGHTAVFTACDRTDLIACAHRRTEVMAEVGAQFDIPKERQYTDYRKLIDVEQPDIISIATQPEGRADIVVYAAEHGVKAIWAEKAMAASMAEADAMVEACERNGVVFNLGTQRRWHPGFAKMRQIIDSGKLGAVKSIVFNGSGLFNGSSHYYDNLLFLNGDRRAVWVQGHLIDSTLSLEGDRLRTDPSAGAVIQFENDVMAYAVLPRREVEWVVTCEKGRLEGWPWGVYRMYVQGPPVYLHVCPTVEEDFPKFEQASASLLLVEDLVRSLDTGAPPIGGVRAAHAGTELIFATIESHLRGGTRVVLPLKGSTLRLDRDLPPGRPKYHS